MSCSIKNRPAVLYKQAKVALDSFVGTISQKHDYYFLKVFFRNSAPTPLIRPPSGVKTLVKSYSTIWWYLTPTQW